VRAATQNTAAGVDVRASGPKLNPIEQSLGGRATFIGGVWIQSVNATWATRSCPCGTEHIPIHEELARSIARRVREGH
jgi:hypothetical protein